MGGLLFQAWAVDPSIDNVVVRQRWPWSRLVDIDYLLSCDDTQRVNIVLSAYNGPTELLMPSGSLSGDLDNVSEGLHRIVWDPEKTAYTNRILTQFSVALTPTPVPLYMIVGLTNALGTPSQIEYVYEEELVTNKWGSWERNPVTNNGTAVQSVIWTGVTNDPVYKTSKLVLRRLPADTQNKVCYAGVFEVTQRQWEWVMGVKKSCNFTTSYETRPVEKVSYNDIRGATNNTPASVNWPTTGSAVLPSSFMGQLRAKTGLTDFDLSTEAQWEYLCRAGTTTVFNDGSTDALITGSVFENNENTNKYLNALGRYKWNGGYLNGAAPLGSCEPTNGTAVVGSYRPNAWGLYDTHGNVWEWTLEWGTGGNRLAKGGCWSYAAKYSSPVNDGVAPPTALYSDYGFRVVRILP